MSLATFFLSNTKYNFPIIKWDDVFKQIITFLIAQDEKCVKIPSDNPVHSGPADVNAGLGPSGTRHQMESQEQWPGFEGTAIWVDVSPVLRACGTALPQPGPPVDHKGTTGLVKIKTSGMGSNNMGDCHLDFLTSDFVYSGLNLWFSWVTREDVSLTCSPSNTLHNGHVNIIVVFSFLLPSNFPPKRLNLFS